MNSQAAHTLELDKVLPYLAGFTVSEAGYEAALSLQPYAVNEMHRQALLYSQGQVWMQRESLRLQPVPSLSGVLCALEQQQFVPDIDAFWALRQVLAQGKLMTQSLLQDAGKQYWSLWYEQVSQLYLPEKSHSALLRCLDDEGRIRDEASPELLLVRGELRRLHQRCIRKVKDVAHEYNIAHYLQDEFMTLSSDRYVLPLKANFKGRLQGVIHDYSQTGETCYFEPLFLVEINNHLQELKQEEREEEAKVIAFLATIVQQELPGIKAVHDLLVDIDLLYARLQLAACYDGRLIVCEEDAPVSLQEACHPLLVLASSIPAQKSLQRYRVLCGMEGTSFDEVNTAPRAVPFTIALEADQRALVISGGNAGGKTVCLKTLGLLSLMARCCLPAPVGAGSFLPIWERLYAFIGDEQSLEDHVSTFTAQITHLARIWDELDAHCLVILDEFGAGTDPSQGAALAQAVIDGIVDKQTHVIAATHFPALKAYALSTPGVRAASVLFDPRTKKPLFTLAYDQVGGSHALEVAREHGLAESVLRKAEQYLLLSGEDTSNLIDRLNQLALDKEQELQGLRKEKVRLAERRKKLQASYDREKEALFSRIQEDAQKVLAAWKEGRATHKQALKQLGAIRNELVEDSSAHISSKQVVSVDVTTLQPGTQVYHIPWKRQGVVLEVDVRKERVRLDLSGVSLWAEAGQLRPKEEKDSSVFTCSKKCSKSSSIACSEAAGAPFPLTQRLDLRGLRADVAIQQLVKSLDTAILHGYTIVEVIHGRGTGALRRELHRYLDTCAQVAAFCLAPEDRGGDGMTIVELK